MNIGLLVQQAMQAVPSTLRTTIALTVSTPALPDPRTGQLGAPSRVEVVGIATQARSDARKLEALKLTDTEVHTLLFVLENDADATRNLVNARVPWGGKPYTVRDVSPIAPDGRAVAFLLVIGR